MLIRNLTQIKQKQSFVSACVTSGWPQRIIVLVVFENEIQSTDDVDELKNVR